MLPSTPLFRGSKVLSQYYAKTAKAQQEARDLQAIQEKERLKDARFLARQQKKAEQEHLWGERLKVLEMPLTDFEGDIKSGYDLLEVIQAETWRNRLNLKANASRVGISLMTTLACLTPVTIFMLIPIACDNTFYDAFYNGARDQLLNHIFPGQDQKLRDYLGDLYDLGLIKASHQVHVKENYHPKYFETAWTLTRLGKKHLKAWRKFKKGIAS